MTPDSARETVGNRLHVTAASCLPARFPDYACGLCAEACPAKAIRLAPGHAPSVAANCFGCGQCAAVCPGGAMQAQGFALPEDVADVAEIRIDCWRVPQGESDPQALRVPCLAGLDAGWLAALFDRSGERPIHLLDRGGCAGCPAGRGMAALKTTLAEVRMQLFEAGAPMEKLPALTFVPSRIAFAEGIPAPEAGQRMGRRAFFRGLAGSLARSAEAFGGDAQDAAAPIVLRNKGEPLGRLRLVTALENIARRHGRALPARALPQLSLGECSGHGVCAGVCPTGALQRQERGDEAEVTFFAARCIACGQCAQSCPERALSVRPSGGGTAVEVLARWQGKRCAGCGERFFGGAGGLCPACRKQEQLSRGMAALFGPRV